MEVAPAAGSCDGPSGRVGVDGVPSGPRRLASSLVAPPQATTRHPTPKLKPRIRVDCFAILSSKCPFVEKAQSTRCQKPA